MIRTLLATALALAALAPVGARAQQAGCGGPEKACETAMGSYHITLPDGPGPHPVLMFLHGYGGSGASLVRDTGTSRHANEKGYAYIAPNALARPGGTRAAWSFHPIFHSHRDERAFFREVLNDAQRRFGIDPSRAVLSGFSIGGSMASYIACNHPGDFTAYAPVAGSLWRPHPESCQGPVRLLHTHGWRDKTVPLEGRVLRQTEQGDFSQGDVFAVLLLWRAVNGCTNYRADSFQTDDYFWRRVWDRCKPGTALELALFDGGHGVPRGWSNLVFSWLDGLDPPPTQ